jgi:predicted metal-binding protein
MIAPGETACPRSAASIMADPVTIYLCVTCRRKTGDAEGAFDLPGRILAVRLAQAIASRARNCAIDVVPVECLAVCKRPSTLALAADGKWTYLIGDLDPELHIGEIIAAAESYSASADGIVPWKERPPTFRKGVIARVPPVAFTHPNGAT